MPPLFRGGGINFWGQRRILEVTPPLFPSSGPPHRRAAVTLGENDFSRTARCGTLPGPVFEAPQVCASVLTIQTPGNANSASKLLIPWNLLLAVFP